MDAAQPTSHARHPVLGQPVVRVLDVVALCKRAHGADGALTLAMAADAMCPENTGVWRLEASAAGGACRRADPAERTSPWTSTRSVRSTSGGASPGTLAAAGRITQHRAGTVAMMAELFPSDPVPFKSIGF